MKINLCPAGCPNLAGDLLGFLAKSGYYATARLDGGKEHYGQLLGWESPREGEELDGHLTIRVRGPWPARIPHLLRINGRGITSITIE